MPLIKKIPLEGGVVGLWEITEKPGNFSRISEILNNDPVFKKIKHTKRKTEFLATRALIEELTGHFPNITYNADGSPFFPGQDKHISISHSADMVAVIIHKNRVGIDVEKSDRPIGKIAHKFLSEKELKFTKCSRSPERSQMICWCAKEAIFKWAPEQGIDFASQIQIAPFSEEKDKNIYANFISGKTYHLKLSFLEEKGNILVWCIY